MLPAKHRQPVYSILLPVHFSCRVDNVEYAERDLLLKLFIVAYERIVFELFHDVDFGFSYLSLSSVAYRDRRVALVTFCFLWAREATLL